MDTLVFDEKEHKYTLNGIEIPSVTRLLEDNRITDYRKIPQAVLQRASAFGTAVHSATELWDIGKLDIKKLSAPLVPYLNAWIKFKDEFGFEMLEVETKVFSKKYMYAGTLDRIGKVTKGKLAGKEILLDIKSGLLLPGAAIQTAAYEHAYKECAPRPCANIKARICVGLREDKYVIEEHSNRSDFNVFIACLQITNFKKLNNIK